MQLELYRKAGKTENGKQGRACDYRTEAALGALTVGVPHGYTSS